MIVTLFIANIIILSIAIAMFTVIDMELVTYMIDNNCSDSVITNSMIKWQESYGKDLDVLVRAMILNLLALSLHVTAYLLYSPINYYIKACC